MLLICVPPAEAVWRWCLLSESGRYILPPDYKHLRPLSNGLYFGKKFPTDNKHMFAVFGHCAILDKNGREIKVRLPEGGELTECVDNEDGPGSKYSPPFLIFSKNRYAGVCDFKGKEIIAARYRQIRASTDGYFVASDEQGLKTIFLDRNGQITAEIPTCDVDFSYTAFSDGFILGEVKRGPWSHCNQEVSRFKFYRPNGQPLALPPLLHADSFSEGYAAVIFSDEKQQPIYSGFIDKSGKLLGDKKFKSAQSFRNGHAIVQIADFDATTAKYAVINKKGQFTIKPTLSLIQENDGKTFIAKDPNGCRLIDAHGKTISLFDGSLTPTPTKGSLLMCLRSGVPSVYADCRGRVFDEDHWPCKGTVAPVWMVKNGTGGWGLYSDTGWLTEPTFACLSQNRDKTWIGLYESKTFERDEWLLKIDRTGAFNKLIKERDLIGMTKSAFLDFFGPGDDGGSNWIRYNTDRHYNCGLAANGYLFQFEDDKLKRWKMSGLMSPIESDLSNSQDWHTHQDPKTDRVPL